MNRCAVALCIAAGFVSAPSASAGQGAPIAAHPVFSGVWSPVNTKAADTFYAARVIPVPGAAKLSIDQRETRITVGIELPEADLDRLTSRFLGSVVYPISRHPIGGDGAGPGRPVDAAWQGEALVIPSFSAWESPKTPVTEVTVTFSLEGPRLSMKTEILRLSTGKVATVTQLFDRAK
jgi:hypothetical protein